MLTKRVALTFKKYEIIILQVGLPMNKLYLSVNVYPNDFKVSYSEKAPKKSTLSTIQALAKVIHNPQTQLTAEKTHEAWLAARELKNQYSQMLNLFQRCINGVMHIFCMQTKEDKIKETYQKIISQDKIRRDILEKAQSFGFLGDNYNDAALYLDLLYSGITSIAQDKAVNTATDFISKLIIKNERGKIDPEKTLQNMKDVFDKNHRDFLNYVPYITRVYLHGMRLDGKISSKKAVSFRPFVYFMITNFLPKIIENPEKRVIGKSHLILDKVRGSDDPWMISLIKAHETELLAFLQFHYYTYDRENPHTFKTGGHIDAMIGYIQKYAPQNEDLQAFVNLLKKYFNPDSEGHGIDRHHACLKEWWEINQEKISNFNWVLRP